MSTLIFSIGTREIYTSARVCALQELAPQLTLLFEREQKGNCPLIISLLNFTQWRLRREILFRNAAHLIVSPWRPITAISMSLITRLRWLPVVRFQLILWHLFATRDSFSLRELNGIVTVTFNSDAQLQSTAWKCRLFCVIDQLGVFLFAFVTSVC